MPAPIGADLRGRTALVTGASAGIGKEIARGLARLGARVVLGCRNREKGEAARREIAEQTGNPELSVSVVDLARRDSIRDFAARTLDDASPLHVLVNNAGTWSSARRLSPDGIELTWATNVLGYVLPTELLLERIRASAPARVVNVASGLAHSLELDDVQFERRRYDGVAAYAQSKQANRMWTWALARRLVGSGVTANALHPGGVNTGLFIKGGGWKGLAGAAYGLLFGKSPAAGADTALWLAASPEPEGVNGRFFVERAERRCRFRDPDAEARLEALCRRMGGLD